MKRFLLLTGAAFATSMLMSCAQPSTYAPTATQAELQQERAAQEAYAKGQKYEDNPQVHIASDAVVNRAARVYSPIQKAGATVCSAMYGVPENQCMFSLEISDRKEINAYADGQKVYITPAMINFAANDNELALVLSHELAHNIMNHPESVSKNATVGALAGTAIDIFARTRGFDTGGAFQQVGANYALMKYSPSFEAEADYVGLYIMARSGFDYNSAAEFWRRMSVRNPDAIYTTTTHPTNPERYVAIQKTASEINQKKQASQPLLPNIKQG